MAYRNRSRGNSRSSYGSRSGGRKSYTKRGGRTARKAPRRRQSAPRQQTVRIILEAPSPQSSADTFAALGLGPKPEPKPRKGKF